MIRHSKGMIKDLGHEMCPVQRHSTSKEGPERQQYCRLPDAE